MIIDTTLLPVFLGAVFILLVTPGPDMIYVTSNTLAGGTKAGMASVFGVASGAYLHILTSALGLSAILLTSEFAYNILRTLGALYLAWVGWKMMTTRGEIPSIEAADSKPLRKVYTQGVLTNFLNPKAALFTLSFVPQFVDPALGAVWGQILVLGVFIVVMMILIDLPIVLSTGKLAKVLKQNKTTSKVLNHLLGLLLIGLSIYVFFTRKPQTHFG